MSDETLREAAQNEWSVMEYGPGMARELLAARAVVEAARAVSASWERDQVPHETACDDVCALDDALAAYDEATGGSDG